MVLSFLISFFGKRLGVVFARFLPYFLVVLTVGLIMWLIYDNGYDSGVEDTELKYQTAIQEERHRQLEANHSALEEARQRQVELERLLDERETKIRELLVQGINDPNAARLSIGTDGVRRVNTIR